ncbi:hypothetical protein HHK36_006275 [Tetracentron sinense]|uniref:Uncharacterized protein n=1 Tax=Tetracentron sinense TaxID=13715 RepID=A0A835DP21_TETSI|nr:hypothetical protein HHK36_006275 [Tetracentron sinense]
MVLKLHLSHKLIGANKDLSFSLASMCNTVQTRCFLGCGDGEERNFLSKIYKERHVIGILTEIIYISSKEVLLLRLFDISAIPNLDINVVICYCSLSSDTIGTLLCQVWSPSLYLDAARVEDYLKYDNCYNLGIETEK